MDVREQTLGEPGQVEAWKKSQDLVEHFGAAPLSHFFSSIAYTRLMWTDIR
jgi:hypothetical protein